MTRIRKLQVTIVVMAGTYILASCIALFGFGLGVPLSFWGPYFLVFFSLLFYVLWLQREQRHRA